MDVEEPGARWLIRDRNSTDAWKLAPSAAVSGSTDVMVCQSYFTLRTGKSTAAMYLDMAVEAQGHIYVLSATGTGSKAKDHLLDVYGPDGRFLFRTPDTNLTRKAQNVVAGKLAVDVWRNVYALAYETLQAQAGSPQPRVTHWTPTPPLFSLPADVRQRYDDRNIAAVADDFAAKDIDLSTHTFVEVRTKGEAWTVRDGSTAYHVYRTAEGLQVYDVPV